MRRHYGARLLRLLVFVLIVGAIGWYVRIKRDEFLRTPVTAQRFVPMSEEPVQTYDYFVETRLQRERTRSLELEQLREVINSKVDDDSLKNDAINRMLTISKNCSLESEIESLTKAKGYPDCIAHCFDGSVAVIIKSKDMSQTDVAVIGDIVGQITGLRPENLRVVMRGE